MNTSTDEQPHTSNSRTTGLLLTIPEVAATLAIGRTKVYELINSGRLEAVHIGRSARVPAAAVDEFVDRQRCEAGHYGDSSTSNEDR